MQATSLKRIDQIIFVQFTVVAHVFNWGNQASCFGVLSPVETSKGAFLECTFWNLRRLMLIIQTREQKP